MSVTLEIMLRRGYRVAYEADLRLSRSDDAGESRYLGVLGYDYRPRAALAAQVPTNYVAFGSRVPLESVRRVALAAADAGVQLRAVCRFGTDRRSDGTDHSALVQVLGVDVLEKRPAIGRATLEAIGGGRPLPCPQ